MRDIGRAACAALREAPQGELEIGGVLFGDYDAGSIQIDTWRPIVCEHADGSNFHFTGRDRVELACLLELARRSGDLRDLQPVGWFVSHPRGSIGLSPSDVEIYNGFFPSVWQVALVVKPVVKGATRFGFFAREADGSLKSTSSYLEFEIELPPVEMAPPPAAETVPIFSWAQPPEPPKPSLNLKSSKTVASLSALSISETAPAQTPILAPPTSSPGFWNKARRLPRYVWICVIAIVLAAGIGGLLLKGRASPHFEPFALHVSDAHQTMQVEWDRDSPLMRAARSAELDIRDGGKSSRFSVSPVEIQAGVVSYARQSGDVDLSMTVYPPNGPPVEGFGRLLAPPCAPESKPAADNKPGTAAAINSATEALELRAERDALRAQVSQLEDAVRKESAEKNRLQDLIRILENRLNIGAGPNSGHDAKQ